MELRIDTDWVHRFNAHGAIVLGYLARRSEEADADGWFTATTDDFRRATGILGATYIQWRQRLQEAGILETRQTGVSEPNQYRLSPPAGGKA